jgi:branched-chain amino acid transport system ATP-binding protein
METDVSVTRPDAVPDDVMLQVASLNAFYGRAQILFDVALQVRRGEVVALMGRNGAGKSTTMKALMGLLDEVRGEVLFRGENIAGARTHRIAQLGMGYVPEDRRIFTDLTVLQNLQVGRQPARAGTVTWTPEKLFALFPNLGSMPTRPGGQMSGGEQQMLTVARTLMGNPYLVLLDEPSEGVAPLIVEQMAEMILHLKQAGMAVLLSEQNLHFAALVSDRAYVLENGHVRYQGTMQDLVADEDLRRAYLSL